MMDIKCVVKEDCKLSKKLKVCVYAICKNEQQFVDRFMESIGDYVDVYIGDTGSTDGTIETFQKYKNATVFQYEIKPWRFDKARQTCLEMIGPKYDLYFSLDIDEVVITKNWKKLVEKQYTEGVNQVYYTFEPYFDVDGKPTSTFLNNRFHSWDFHWTYPIHEVITPNEGLQVKAIKVSDLVIHHFPDPTKTSTASYLPLLEMASEEMPDDARTAHYLGREYYYHGRFEDAIRLLEKHVTMPSSWWKSERSCSMRIIAECYVRMNKDDNAEFWYMKACIETTEREAYIELAKFYYFRQRWRECLQAASKAFDIKVKNYDHYSGNHYSWNGGPEDLMAVSYYNLGMVADAHKFAQLAVQADPNFKRFQDNELALRNILMEMQRQQSIQLSPGISLINPVT